MENTIYYQQKTHHRQNLRANILPQTYQKLEANQNPSAVSRNVYKSLYKDSLQKQMHQQSKPDYSPDRLPLKQKKTESIFANAGSQVFKKSEYPDYHQDKYKKIQEHIQINDDGGKDFYRASQLYERNIRNKHHEAMKETLAKQIRDKQINKHQRQNMKNYQNQQFNKTLQQHRNMAAIQKIQNLKMRQNKRHEQIKQVEAEQAKRNRHSIFHLGSKGRHNPITNPIEYHIDNPYILQEIQNRNMNRGSLA